MLLLPSTTVAPSLIDNVLFRITGTSLIADKLIVSV